MNAELRIDATPIDGLLVVRLPLHGDSRGWFKEHWHRAKMTALGLPDFKPVQQNISYNADAGTTRGMHAEPWDKYVSVDNGRAFGAWLDLREGPGYGRLFTAELGADTAVFVPRGVANGFQTLDPDTNYIYLVNDHWSPSAKYTLVNLADPELAIPWPVPLEQATVSDKDRRHPPLSATDPLAPARTVVLGANGQLGRALRVVLGDRLTDYLSRQELDLCDIDAIRSYDWSGVGTVINAAAFTSVDGAETAEGRRAAWRINASAVQELARACIANDMALVHISTDYVFDGEQTEHPEDEPLAPLNTYGASKAAGELAAGLVPKHFIVRTSWVVGDGPNFIRTMAKLARDGVSPSVISDQYGRLTYASDLAWTIQRLLTEAHPWGTYNVTGGGPIQSWYEIAREVFGAVGADPDNVKPIRAADYAAGRRGLGMHAHRPEHSALPMGKLERLGIEPRTSPDRVRTYLADS